MLPYGYSHSMKFFTLYTSLLFSALCRLTFVIIGMTSNMTSDLSKPVDVNVVTQVLAGSS